MVTEARQFKDYPRPSLAVDPAIISVHKGRMYTLLWRRQYPPQQGCWAIPGVFVNESEQLEQAVARGLRTKANLHDVSHLEQLFTWNKTGRDPRGWVVTVAYFVLAPYDHLKVAVNDEKGIALFALKVRDDSCQPARVIAMNGQSVNLSFDHAEILSRVVTRLRDRIWQSAIALSLLPEKFTLHEMRAVYEAILGARLNKDSFRRRVIKTRSIIQPTGEYQEDVNHRPAELFTRSPEQ